MPTPKLEYINLVIEGIAVETFPPFRSGGSIKYLHLLTSYAVHRLSQVSDGQGGWTETYRYDHTIQGRLRPATSSERTVAEKNNVFITHVLSVQEGSDIKEGDHLVFNNRSIAVKSVTETSDHHHYSAEGEEMRDGRQK